MKLRILVRFFVLIAAFVASLVATPSFVVLAQSEGAPREGGTVAYQTPVKSGEFSITQYPQRLNPGSVCTHRTGTRNAEAYDLIPRDSAFSVPILAVADGTVIYYGAEYANALEQGWGYYVLLEHKDGLRSVYAHLNDFLFTPQQQERYTAHRADPAKNGPLTVSAGDAIGIMGSTGVSSGRHLHFSLYNATGRFVDNNILGTPEPAEKHIPDFSSAPKELSGSCPEGIALRASGAGQGEFSGASGSGSSGSVVTVKTGSLGFRILYERVNSLYAFSIGIGGILAFILIIYAGIRYSLSLGNASKAKEALDQAQAALTGLVLLLALYPILYTVNPCIVDPLRMGDRRDKEGRIVRVPICAVSKLFGAGSGSGTVTVTGGSLSPAPVAAPSAPSSGSSPVAWDWSVGFTDQNGRPIERAVKGQTLKLTAKTGPQKERVFFEIRESDYELVRQRIRTLDLKNAIEGKIGSDGIARGEWTITQEDLEEGWDDSGDFDFLLFARTESGKKKSPVSVPEAGRVSVATSEKNKPDPTPTPEPAVPVIPPFVPGQPM